MSCRASGKRPEVHRPVIRIRPHRWEKVLPTRARELGPQNYRDGVIDSPRECLLGFPNYGEIVACPDDSRADLRLRHAVPFVNLGFSLDKADVSKVIEVREPGEFTKEAVDARLSIF